MGKKSMADGSRAGSSSTHNFFEDTTQEGDVGTAHQTQQTHEGTDASYDTELLGEHDRISTKSQHASQDYSNLQLSESKSVDMHQQVLVKPTKIAQQNNTKSGSSILNPTSSQALSKEMHNTAAASSHGSQILQGNNKRLFETRKQPKSQQNEGNYLQVQFKGNQDTQQSLQNQELQQQFNVSSNLGVQQQNESTNQKSNYSKIPGNANQASNQLFQKPSNTSQAKLSSQGSSTASGKQSKMSSTLQANTAASKNPQTKDQKSTPPQQANSSTYYQIVGGSVKRSYNQMPSKEFSQTTANLEDDQGACSHPNSNHTSSSGSNSQNQSKNSSVNNSRSRKRRGAQNKSAFQQQQQSNHHTIQIANYVNELINKVCEKIEKDEQIQKEKQLTRKEDCLSNKGCQENDQSTHLNEDPKQAINFEISPEDSTVSRQQSNLNRKKPEKVQQTTSQLQKSQDLENALRNANLMASQMQTLTQDKTQGKKQSQVPQEEEDESLSDDDDEIFNDAHSHRSDNHSQFSQDKDQIISKVKDSQQEEAQTEVIQETTIVSAESSKKGSKYQGTGQQASSKVKPIHLKNQSMVVGAAKQTSEQDDNQSLTNQEFAKYIFIDDDIVSLNSISTTQSGMNPQTQSSQTQSKPQQQQQQQTQQKRQRKKRVKKDNKEDQLNQFMLQLTAAQSNNSSNNHHGDDHARRQGKGGHHNRGGRDRRGGQQDNDPHSKKDLSQKDQDVYKRGGKNSSQNLVQGSINSNTAFKGQKQMSTKEDTYLKDKANSSKRQSMMSNVDSNKSQGQVTQKSTFNEKTQQNNSSQLKQAPGLVSGKPSQSGIQPKISSSALSSAQRKQESSYMDSNLNDNNQYNDSLHVPQKKQGSHKTSGFLDFNPPSQDGRLNGLATLQVSKQPSLQSLTNTTNQQSDSIMNDENLASRQPSNIFDQEKLQNELLEVEKQQKLNNNEGSDNSGESGMALNTQSHQQNVASQIIPNSNMYSIGSAINTQQNTASSSVSNSNQKQAPGTKGGNGPFKQQALGSDSIGVNNQYQAQTLKTLQAQQTIGKFNSSFAKEMAKQSSIAGVNNSNMKLFKQQSMSTQAQSFTPIGQGFQKNQFGGAANNSGQNKFSQNFVPQKQFFEQDKAQSIISQDNSDNTNKKQSSNDVASSSSSQNQQLKQTSIMQTGSTQTQGAFNQYPQRYGNEFNVQVQSSNQQQVPQFHVATNQFQRGQQSQPFQPYPQSQYGQQQSYISISQVNSPQGVAGNLMFGGQTANSSNMLQKMHSEKPQSQSVITSPTNAGGMGGNMMGNQNRFFNNPQIHMQNQNQSALLANFFNSSNFGNGANIKASMNMTPSQPQQDMMNQFGQQSQMQGILQKHQSMPMHIQQQYYGQPQQMYSQQNPNLIFANPSLQPQQFQHHSVMQQQMAHQLQNAQAFNKPQDQLLKSGAQNTDLSTKNLVPYLQEDVKTTTSDPKDSLGKKENDSAKQEVAQSNKIDQSSQDEDLARVTQSSSAVSGNPLPKQKPVQSQPGVSSGHLNPEGQWTKHQSTLPNQQAKPQVGQQTNFMNLLLNNQQKSAPVQSNPSQLFVSNPLMSHGNPLLQQQYSRHFTSPVYPSNVSGQKQQVLLNQKQLYNQAQAYEVIQSSFYDRLDQEIKDHINATQQRLNLLKGERDYILTKLTKMTESLFKDEKPELKLYGSIVTGLAWKNSDMDLAVTGLKIEDRFAIVSNLQVLADAMRDWHLIEELKSIETAAIPVIKAQIDLRKVRKVLLKQKIEDQKSATQSSEMSLDEIVLEIDEKKIEEEIPEDQRYLALDISFDDTPENANILGQNQFGANGMNQIMGFDSVIKSHLGLQSCDLIKWYVQHYRNLKEVSILLKEFLASHELNSSYLGGLSSYSTVLLVVAYMNHYRLKNSLTLTPARLLMGFLEFFSTIFNPTQYGINVIREDSFYELTTLESNFVILDPLNLSNNTTKNSHRTREIIGKFQVVFNNLKGLIVGYHKDLVTQCAQQMQNAYSQVDPYAQGAQYLSVNSTSIDHNQSQANTLIGGSNQENNNTENPDSRKQISSEVKSSEKQSALKVQTASKDPKNSPEEGESKSKGEETASQTQESKTLFSGPDSSASKTAQQSQQQSFSAVTPVPVTGGLQYPFKLQPFYQGGFGDHEQLPEAGEMYPMFYSQPVWQDQFVHFSEVPFAQTFILGTQYFSEKVQSDHAQ